MAQKSDVSGLEELEDSSLNQVAGGRPAAWNSITWFCPDCQYYKQEWESDILRVPEKCEHYDKPGCRLIPEEC